MNVLYNKCFFRKKKDSPERKATKKLQFLLVLQFARVQHQLVGVLFVLIDDDHHHKFSF